ncbi:MAG: NAD(P)-dependent oxidoreductase [Holosporaceae bacterium]|jgi:nucleoside-diphosphate-sugar epimerase|nr:NAD(P)-dependent oxidoreductase [Holosporaceae bacterium]
MKILLLGGEGFIGRNIAETLPGNFRYYSLGRSPSPFRSNGDNFIKTDIYTDVIGESFDVYVHLINNDPGRELFLIKNINPDAHVILFSSAVIYANPSSEYAKRKQLLERVYSEHCKKLTVLRLFNVYGRYQIPHRQGSLVANILYNHINNVPIEINDMNAERDFMFAADIAKYIESIIENSLYGIYDLATGHMYPLKKLCAVMQKAMSLRLNIVELKQTADSSCPHASRIVPCNVQNCSLESGLEKTFDFFRKNNEILKELLS